MKIRLSSSATYGLALFVIFCIAFFLRIYLQYDRVFADGWVRFYDNDPWYHMRLIENLSHHFPHLNSYDPYMVYPGGQSISTGPFFDLLIGFFAWVVGLGSPSQHVIETVGAFIPAIMGALITVTVYFIGRELFNRTVGLLGAALIAILPGNFFPRTMLGYPDHHVAELFFSTLTMMFLILAMKKARESLVSFSNLRNGDWKLLSKPLIYSLLTGIVLGLYLLSWRSGVFLVFIIFAFVTIQFIIDHLKGRPTDYLGIVFIPSFLIALVIRAAPVWSGYQSDNLQVASLVISIVAFVTYSLLSYGMVSRNMKGYYYPLLLAIAGGIGIVIFHLVDTSLLNSMLNKFRAFTPSGGMLTIGEVKGLSFSMAWDYFSTGLYISFISLAIVGYILLKEGTPDKTLLLVWSIIVLAATLGQNRNAYYLAVNVAILTAYFSWRILDFPSFIKVLAKSKKREILTSTERLRQVKASEEKQEVLATKHRVFRYAYVVVAVVVIFFLAFFPNIGNTLDQANKINDGPNDDWHESLVWMRNNTPDPFQNPDFFYAQYKRPAAGEGSIYPESAYGVMSWWDYGYWITYIAHRIPNTNPGQLNAQSAGLFFTAQSESEAVGILDQMGSKYVVIDFSMPFMYFKAMAIWAGKEASEFREVYRIPNERGEFKTITLYHSEYYLSMISRLYNFGGKAWDPDDFLKNYPYYKIQAISYIQRTDDKGNKYREITDTKLFDSYIEAKAFVNAKPDYIIVGDSPVISPVPLDELKHFKLIHKSPTWAVLQLGLGETISYVEIFEYYP